MNFTALAADIRGQLAEEAEQARIAAVLAAEDAPRHYTAFLHTPAGEHRRVEVIAEDDAAARTIALRSAPAGSSVSVRAADLSCYRADVLAALPSLPTIPCRRTAAPAVERRESEFGEFA